MITEAPVSNAMHHAPKHQSFHADDDVSNITTTHYRQLGPPTLAPMIAPHLAPITK